MALPTVRVREPDHAPADPAFTNPALWLDGGVLRRQVMVAMLLSVAVLAGFIHDAGLHIDPTQIGLVPYYVVGAVLLALRFGLPPSKWSWAGPVSRFSEYAGLFTLMALMGATASYPVAGLTHGYADATLQGIDERLGFDWLYLYRVVAAHPFLQGLGTIVYRSIYVTPAVLLWCAAKNADHKRAYSFMLRFWLATILTLIFFALMPAIGPFSYLWHQAIPYMPESEQWQSGLIPALRAHTLHVIDVGHLRGIVSAPSFHTAAAVLYIVAGWHIPALRWPIVALNVAMLLSTPVEGTHYLIDMILGAGVAVMAIALARWWEQGLATRALG
ncbi:phosphatase PAP2 family protein [Novosphingobium sp. Rr 2-17]|uniref:phosphatase PAP2 family protein n=1 Tax=Novosphingobium sp. Rr 2-17 TaxID=555793 RepID=UPI001ED93025|nr:phosphatase PAP2 family protein [Novosphingobium sp. Rr 2-17]